MLYHILVEKNLFINRPVICIGKKHYTYYELDSMVHSFREFLRHKGIVKGDKIVIITVHCINTVVAILGCIASGVVFIPLDPKMVPYEKKQILDETCARCVVDGCWEELAIENGWQQVQRERQQEDDQVYILYTSGSTGCSKGVIGCVRQIMFCVERINKRLMNGNGDRILCALPLSFDYGLYQIFLALSSGAELFLEDGSNLQKLPAILQRERITAFPVVPAMLHMLVHAGFFERLDLPELRYICATGDKLNLRAVKAIHDRFPYVEIIPMYGLTECKRVSIMPMGNYEKTIKGSCGLPLEDVEVRLLNPDHEGIGELIVIGGNVMEGYYLDEGEEVFFFDSATGKKALRTGDLFQIDKEGFLYFGGRIKRMIKCRGFRISNVRIENYFNGLQELLEIRVLGIPDEMTGEKIGLAAYGTDPDINKLIFQVCHTLPTLYRPHLVYISEAPLPKSINGKYDDSEICRQIIAFGEKWI